MSPSATPDGASQQQAVRRVLLENTEVAVIETTYPKGGAVPMHAHRFPHALYVVEGGTLQTMAPDDSTGSAEAGSLNHITLTTRR